MMVRPQQGASGISWSVRLDNPPDGCYHPATMYGANVYFAWWWRR